MKEGAGARVTKNEGLLGELVGRGMEAVSFGSRVASKDVTPEEKERDPGAEGESEKEEKPEDVARASL